MRPVLWIWKTLAKNESPFQAGELAEVDGQDAVKLALVDGAGAKPAADVGQHVVGVFQAVDDAALAEPFAEAGRIAVVRQAGRDRRRRQESRFRTRAGRAGMNPTRPGLGRRTAPPAGKPIKANKAAGATGRNTIARTTVPTSTRTSPRKAARLVSLDCLTARNISRRAH